jgi:hypothetical protein
MAVKIALDEYLSIREGRLFIEECGADKLAHRFQRDLVPDRLRRSTMTAPR